MNPVKIDVRAMPKIEVKLLCSTILEAVQRFYENPQSAADFEAWRKEDGHIEKAARRGEALTGSRLSVNAEIPHPHYRG